MVGASLLTVVVLILPFLVGGLIVAYWVSLLM